AYSIQRLRPCNRRLLERLRPNGRWNVVPWVAVRRNIWPRRHISATARRIQRTVMPEQASPTGRAEPGAQQRQCGPCTACCDGWLKIEVYGHQVDRGQPCPGGNGRDDRLSERSGRHPCRLDV